MRSPLAAVAALLCCLAVPASAQEVPGAEVVLRLRDPRIVEASGLAVSRRHPGVLWTHNDSGDPARLFAVGADGRTRAVLTLAGPCTAGRDSWEQGQRADGKGRSEAWPHANSLPVAE